MRPQVWLSLNHFEVTDVAGSYNTSPLLVVFDVEVVKVLVVRRFEETPDDDGHMVQTMRTHDYKYEDTWLKASGQMQKT